MVSSKTKQEVMWPEEANAEWLNLALIHSVRSQLICHPGSQWAFLGGCCLSPWNILFVLSHWGQVSLKKIALLMFLRPQDYLPVKTMPARRDLFCLNSLLSQKFSLSLIFYIQNIFGILDLHLISTDTWKTKCPGLNKERKEGRSV